MNITREQVERIATDGPWNNQTKNSLGSRVCYHCDFVEPNHAEDCVWVLAKALLAADDALEWSLARLSVLDQQLDHLRGPRLPYRQGKWDEKMAAARAARLLGVAELRPAARLPSSQGAPAC